MASPVRPAPVGPAPVRPSFDDRSDVAAVVYDRADDPDALLAAFLRDLHAQGFDAVEVVQTRRAPPPPLPPPPPRWGMRTGRTKPVITAIFIWEYLAASGKRRYAP